MQHYFSLLIVLYVVVYIDEYLGNICKRRKGIAFISVDLKHLTLVACIDDL